MSGVEIDPVVMPRREAERVVLDHHLPARSDVAAVDVLADVVRYLAGKDEVGEDRIPHDQRGIVRANSPPVGMVQRDVIDQ